MILGMMEEYCNRVMKEEVDTLFGKGSKIEFLSAFPVTQSKSQQVVVKVHITDPESALSDWPENIYLFVEDSFNFVHGNKKDLKLIVQSSYQLI